MMDRINKIRTAFQSLTEIGVKFVRWQRRLVQARLLKNQWSIYLSRFIKKTCLLF
jgi:hypothetical protein